MVEPLERSVICHKPQTGDCLNGPKAGTTVVDTPPPPSQTVKVNQTNVSRAVYCSPAVSTVTTVHTVPHCVFTVYAVYRIVVVARK